MKYLTLKSIFFSISCVCLIGTFTGCKNDLDPILDEIEFDRVLTPTGLTAIIRTQTTIELNWQLRNNADSYVVEFSEDSLAFNEIIRTRSVLPSELPIRETFFGETRYSARVKAIADGIAESNWTAITIRTNPEQIFLPTPGENVQGTYATLVWIPGSEVTNLLIQPGNIYIPLSEDQIALGEATVEGISGATSYTATIYNGTKKRGTTSFTTLKEANVTPLDDLGAVIDAAAEGAILILAEGNYTLGSKAITKSITIEGQKSYDMPVITGQLTCGTTVASITLKNLTFTGGAVPLGQFFNATAATCNLGSLTIDGCDISGYTNNIIYNNSAGTYGDILITNSYIHDIPGLGGDGFDIRGGTFGSLTVENSTISTGIRTLLRMQVPADVAFRNVTFYKVCNVVGGNNRGFFRMSGAGRTIEVSKCLFVETGVDEGGGVTRGSWTLAASDMNAAVTPTFSANYYSNVIGLFTGLYTSPSQVSASEANPGFVDAPNGNFKLTNQTLIDNQIGDPRWWH